MLIQLVNCSSLSVHNLPLPLAFDHLQCWKRDDNRPQKAFPVNSKMKKTKENKRIEKLLCFLDKVSEKSEVYF